MKASLCRNCGHRHWPHQSCPRDTAARILIALALFLSPIVALAHPGHGETLHAHPELYAAIVVLAFVVTYFRRKAVQ